MILNVARHVVAGARRAGLSVLGPADFGDFPSQTISREHSENRQWASGKNSLLMYKVRLILANRKALLTQIITCYNHGMQKSISECTQNLEATTPGVKIDQQNTGKCSLKAALSLNFFCNIWIVRSEIDVNTSCFVSTVEAGDGGVTAREVFSWHTSSPSVLHEH